VNEIEARYFNKSKSWEKFTPYSQFMNGVAVTMGFDDQFNYYLSSGFGLGITKNFSGVSARLNFISEKENSLQVTKYQSIIKTNKIPRINPKIIEGMDNRASLNILVGKDPTDIQVIPEDGIKAQIDLSNPASASDFNYKKVQVTGLIKMKTFYKELFIAPYIEIIADAGIVTGYYGPQHLFSPNTVLGFFAPPGAFKDLSPYRYVGTEMASLQIEHNWRSIPFQELGLNFISDMYLDLITGASVLKTWNKSDYLPYNSMDKPYWEIYAGISRILAAFRVDVSYNSLRYFSVTAAVGVVL
jgi:hypothetical protein